MTEIKLVNNSSNWMESTALRQLESIAKYPGVFKVVGLPDLHAGRTPVGLAVMSRGYIYPYLIGNDIGCGMGLYKSGVPLRKLKIEKWESRLNNIREFADLPFENPYADDCPIVDMGSIGGGNHFIEFQKVENIFLKDDFLKLGFEENELLLLVHTGSRGLGERIMRRFSSENGYAADDPQAMEYLKQHDQALFWAKKNRELSAIKILDWLGFDKEPHCLIDCHHNYMESRDGFYIHRKGAIATYEAAVIPGSRGSLSYVVKPLEDLEEVAWSISHGAGRKWARSLCRSRIKNKYDRNSIRRTSLNSRVVCHDTDLLFQEAPEAYKNIEDVIEALLEHKLIEVVATLKPLITYKG